MEIPFRVTDDITGEPVTDLTKADVVLKLSDSPYTIMPYTELGTIGSAKGEYVLWGVNFYPATCRLWIKGVVQDNWFGAQEIGDLNLKYVTFSGNNTFSGTNTFSIAPKSSVAPSSTNDLTRKDYVDVLHSTKSTLTGNNNFTGVNLFGQVKITGGNTSGTKTEFRGWTYFMDCPYLLGGVTPTNYYHLVHKGYVDNLILQTDTYQESNNIVRVIPSGTEQIGTVYTTIGYALTYCDSQTPTINKQYTILITGEGTGSSIDLATVNGKYLHDYVHYKGLGSDIVINLPVVSGTEYTATDYSRVVWEDLTLQANDSENDLVIQNITFKNCKLNVLDASSVTISNCNFEGTNYFIANTNVITFTNCIGAPIYCNNPQLRGGTNLINYTTPTTFKIGSESISAGNGIVYVDKITISGTNLSTVSNQFNIGSTTQIQGDLNIGTVNISDDASVLVINKPVEITDELKLVSFIYNAPDTTGVGSISEKYGAVDDKVLTTPTTWLNVTIDGNIYTIPCYTPKA